MSEIDTITRQPTPSRTQPRTASGVDPTTASSSQDRGIGELGSDEFLQIILTELGKQDPLQPNDTKALLEQISMVRSIQSDVDLTDRLKSLVGQNEFASASSLIGKRVEGLTRSNERRSDVVVSVGRRDGESVLTLRDGGEIAISRVDRVLLDSESQP
ncbi:MAG: flagellar hook capping FlgD N-terminal domain-containing protein [Planctomycetota bacterium]|nr:flagellar hook capping FlgD N-terminal domain-containing protein [Planctomycetota bacterium]